MDLNRFKAYTAHLAQASQSLKDLYGFEVYSLREAVDLEVELSDFLTKRNFLIYQGVVEKIDEAILEVVEVLSALNNFIRVWGSMEAVIG